MTREIFKYIKLAAEDLKKLDLSEKDVVIGLAASGRTPYVIGGALIINQKVWHGAHLFGGESFLEFAHGLITHNDHMITLAFAMLGYLLITFWVIRTSSNFDRKATKRMKERDRKLVERR